MSAEDHLESFISQMGYQSYHDQDNFYYVYTVVTMYKFRTTGLLWQRRPRI